MKTGRTLNAQPRTWQPPADGWYQISPLGERPGKVEFLDDDGQPVSEDCIQVFSEAHFDNVIARFREMAKEPGFKGVLVDYEHFSTYPDKPSAAAAWCMDLEKRMEDPVPEFRGLYARLDLTRDGEEDLRNGRYRGLSPDYTVDFIGERDGRPLVAPVQLCSIGLTNTPMLKRMKACSNSARSRNRISTTAAVPAGGEQKTPATAGTGEKQTMTPEQIKAALLKLLGLPDTATDAEVQAACDASGGESMNALRTKCRDLEKKAFEREADAFISSLPAGTVKDATLVKELYVKDRDATKKLFGAIHAAAPAAAAPVRTLSKEKTAMPAAAPGSVADRDADRARASRIRNRAHELKKSLRIPFNEAFRRASHEIA